MAAAKEDQRVRIEVNGEVEILLPAERAVLNLVVKKQSQDKNESAQAVIASAKQVNADALTSHARSWRKLTTSSS